jgi:hypothetical protein
VHPHLFRSELTKEAGVLEYQVCQTPTGAIIRIAGSRPADHAELSERLVKRLERVGLVKPEVLIEPTPSIERNAASGKLKRFVPLAGP